MIEREKGFYVMPAYEVTCPRCKHKNIFDKEIMSGLTNIFCNYCNKRLEHPTGQKNQ